MANKVENELTKWIDTRAIAQEILFWLKEQGIEENLENAAIVWLDFFTNSLAEGLKSSTRYALNLTIRKG